MYIKKNNLKDITAAYIWLRRVERFQEVCQETLPSKMLLWTFKIARSLATSPAKMLKSDFHNFILEILEVTIRISKMGKQKHECLIVERAWNRLHIVLVHTAINWFLFGTQACLQWHGILQTTNVWWILLISVFQFFYTELLERITFFEETSQSNWEIPIYYEMTQKWNFCQSNLFPR